MNLNEEISPLSPGMALALLCHGITSAEKVEVRLTPTEEVFEILVGGEWLAVAEDWIDYTPLLNLVYFVIIKGKPQ